MPGRSAAPSRTVDRMIASCASVVGCCSAREIPRIMSPLAIDAEGRRAPVDGVRRDELASAAVTGKANSTVGLQLLDEATALAARVAIITETRSARFDRFRQHADDGGSQAISFFQRHRCRRTRWIDARTPERLVCVDVADACDFSLLH